MEGESPAALRSHALPLAGAGVVSAERVPPRHAGREGRAEQQALRSGERPGCGVQVQLLVETVPQHPGDADPGEGRAYTLLQGPSGQARRDPREGVARREVHEAAGEHLALVQGDELGGASGVFDSSSGDVRRRGQLRGQARCENVPLEGAQLHWADPADSHLDAHDAVRRPGDDARRAVPPRPAVEEVAAMAPQLEGEVSAAGGRRAPVLALRQAWLRGAPSASSRRRVLVLGAVVEAGGGGREGSVRAVQAVDADLDADLAEDAAGARRAVPTDVKVERLAIGAQAVQKHQVLAAAVVLELHGAGRVQGDAQRVAAEARAPGAGGGGPGEDVLAPAVPGELHGGERWTPGPGLRRACGEHHKMVVAEANLGQLRGDQDGAGVAVQSRHGPKAPPPA
mmetsp:Transcript_106270/g.328074  ORF Transcript_106270/g.328074 Transcript_106270/m.328074 type:complete len:398 (-) Transcript_106270:1324-2517(-)